MCRIGSILCDSTQWGDILAWGDNKKARVLQPIGQRNHDPKLLITKDLSAKIALLSDSVCQPSTLGQGELLLKLRKCTKAVVIVSTLLCANKYCPSFLIFNLSPPSDSRLPQSPPSAHCAVSPLLTFFYWSFFVNIGDIAHCTLSWPSPQTKVRQCTESAKRYCISALYMSLCSVHIQKISQTVELKSC